MDESGILDGPPVDLQQMLQARDACVERQRTLLEDNPHSSLLHVGLRIAGSVKTGHALEQVFDQAVNRLHQLLEAGLLDQDVLHLPTGPEAFLVSLMPGGELKEDMLNFEVYRPFCTLMDLDVLTLKEGHLIKISREDLGRGPRPCLVCERPAKECARSRRHRPEEIRAVVETLVSSGWES